VKFPSHGVRITPEGAQTARYIPNGGPLHSSPRCSGPYLGGATADNLSPADQPPAALQAAVRA
jgi:hypothetical protein